MENNRENGNKKGKKREIGESFDSKSEREI